MLPTLSIDSRNLSCTTVILFSSFSLLRRDILSFNKQTNSTEDSTRFSLWIRTLNGGVVRCCWWGGIINLD
jgi:hypothetical protein